MKGKGEWEGRREKLEVGCSLEEIVDLEKDRVGQNTEEALG